MEICPQEIKKYLIDKKIEENTVGCEDGNVYKITDKDGSAYYLKVKDETINGLSLYSEYQKTLWLKERIKVPAPVEYSKYNNKEFFLMEEAKGKMSFEIDYFNNHEEVITVLAKNLLELHSLNIGDCPFDQTLKSKLEQAKYNVENNLVDESDFDDENIGKTAKELYKELLENIPDNEDVVMAHGDYCMPNIIIDSNLSASLIDVGRIGLADKYQDISLILISIEYNFNTNQYNGLFLDKYGIKNLDQKKLFFYKLLDEFF